MEFPHLISFVLDLVLVLAAILAYLARPRIGGELANGLSVLMAGVMILGFAHLAETLLFALLHLDLVLNEIVHRLIVVIGSIYVALGFLTMRQAFEK